MKFLLDTHAFLWWIGDDARLSPTAKDTISDANNDIFFSVVSAWEMAIKLQSGKLSLKDDLRNFLKKNIGSNHFSVLPISLAHTLQSTTLRSVHRDPFDRMLIAQAKTEKMQLITRDPEIAKYTVSILW